MHDRAKKSARQALRAAKEALRLGSDETGRAEMREVGRRLGELLSEMLPRRVQRGICQELSEGPEEGEEKKLTASEIYTDGSCLENPGGPGGWAFVTVKGEEREETRREESGHEASTTNNRMELRAILEALKRVQDGDDPDLYTDSKYALFTTQKKWEAKQNLDLLRQIWEEVDRVNVDFAHVPGHSGHQYNERADKLARNAAREGS